eukprot:TRINITY_DN334_c0_g1_i7.p1 TRINITY_DN334_c0_g1~~TRINITY_DN334_c0_g1_i7.p1  ORF type:complete len:142 (+),score=8.20 TRINITY_DN334_c0_g1_i7:136-561(+)
MHIILHILISCSCGYCGHPLNLSSSDRNTSNIGSKYGKAIKKGMISFLTVDESRFMIVNEQKCWPEFPLKFLWRYLKIRPKVKLLCGNCHMFIGYGYEDITKSSSSDSSDSGLSSGASGCRSYAVKIRALQPSDEPCAYFQ